MSWKLGLFNMRALIDPKSFDADLLSVRFRFCQDDTYNQRDTINDYIGGPGYIRFASHKHPEKVYSYKVHEWLKEENCSYQCLKKELNNIFDRYFKVAHGWNKRQLDEFAPHASITTFNEIDIHSKRALNRLEEADIYLRIVLDPNLAYALHLVGFIFNAYTADDWFRFSLGVFDKTTREFDFNVGSDWSAFLKTAVYPIKHRDAGRNFMWDIIYPIDEYGGSWNSLEESLHYRTNPFLTAEEQVLHHLRDVLFPTLTRTALDNQESKYFKTLTASYEPNKHDPQIRQLRLHFTSAKADWWRTAFTFSPLLVQLFNWNGRFLSGGTSIVVDHNATDDFLITMANKAPPTFDYLKGKIAIDINALIQDRKRIEILKKKSGDQLAHIIVEPQLQKGEPQLMGFYYPSSKRAKILPKLQICPNTIYANVCLRPQLRYSLEDLPQDELRRSYNLQSACLVVKAAVVNEDHSSLSKKAPVLPVDQIISSRMIANVEVTLDNGKERFIIDTSNGHYPVREWVLKKMINIIKNVEEEDPANKAPAFAGSREFTAHIYPFKYCTVPDMHIFTSSKIRVKVDLEDAHSFTVTKGGKSVKNYALRINHVGSSLEFSDSAILTEDLVEGLEFVRFRNHPVYKYKQFCIEKHVLTKGSIETRTGDLFQRTNANRFFVVMRKATGSDAQTALSLDFQTFDIVKMSLEEGTEPIDGPIFFNMEDTSMRVGLYKRYLKNVGNRNEAMSQSEFEEGCVIFCFNRSFNSTPSERAGRKIRIELLFQHRLPCDVELYCIAETDETFELNYNGDVVNSSRQENEFYVNYRKPNAPQDTAMEGDMIVGVPALNDSIFVNHNPPIGMEEDVGLLQNFNHLAADNSAIFKNSMDLAVWKKRRAGRGSI